MKKKRAMALRFCSLWASGTKLSYSLHVENTKHTQRKFFIGCISSSLDCFSITKKLREHVKHCRTIFLSMKLAMRNFTANSNTHVCKFGWTKFDTHTVLFSLFTASSSLPFFLMQWVKSTVIFLSRLCFKFFVWPGTLWTISLWLERKRNSLICCGIQQKIHKTHKIFFWLECIRSWHKEFAHLLYNSTENTWNSQNLAA